MLRLSTKFEVRRISRSEDTAHLMYVSAVVGAVTLTFDLLTLKRVHGSPGSWASMVPNMGFRGFSVLDLCRGMGRTDRQTDDGHQRLMPPPYGGRGHNK